MMTYVVSWDGPSAEEPGRGNKVDVCTVAELDLVLERVAAQASAEDIPYAVQIYRSDAPGSLMVGVGHPRRSMLDWLVPNGLHEYGCQPGVPPWTEAVGFDVYGNWHERSPEKLRITPEAARNATREYVQTGQRPTCVEIRNMAVLRRREAGIGVRPIGAIGGHKFPADHPILDTLRKEYEEIPGESL